MKENFNKDILNDARRLIGHKREQMEEEARMMAGNNVYVQGSYVDIHDNEVVNLSIDKAGEVKVGDNHTVNHGADVVSELPKGEEAKKASQTSTIPSELDNDRARNILQRFVDAGMLDGQFQPLVSRAQAALIADAVSMQLNIVKKWKVFESLWKRKNIRNDYNKAFSQTTVHMCLTKINSIING